MAGCAVQRIPRNEYTLNLLWRRSESKQMTLLVYESSIITILFKMTMKWANTAAKPWVYNFHPLSTYSSAWLRTWRIHLFENRETRRIHKAEVSQGKFLFHDATTYNTEGYCCRVVIRILWSGCNTVILLGFTTKHQGRLLVYSRQRMLADAMDSGLFWREAFIRMHKEFLCIVGNLRIWFDTEISLISYSLES